MTRSRLHTSKDLLQALTDPDCHIGVEHPVSHHGPSVRRFRHAGRNIEIETTYRITVDGEPFADTLHVDPDGSVHYHGLPQYGTFSAVELVKAIVDKFRCGEVPPKLNHDRHPNGRDVHGHSTHGEVH